ncbi:MAG: hypothetical protein RLZ86_1983 [Actinomycetota bacterium]
MVSLEQLPLATPHRLALVIVGVIPSEHVQHTVNDEQCHLVVERSGVRGSLCLGHFGTDHDVAQKKRQVGRVGFGTIRAAARTGVRRWGLSPTCA